MILAAYFNILPKFRLFPFFSGKSNANVVRHAAQAERRMIPFTPFPRASRSEPLSARSAPLREDTRLPLFSSSFP